MFAWLTGSATQRPTSRRLVLEALEDRLVPSTVVAEVEPNNVKGAATAFSFPLDGTVQLTGTSTSQRDRDFFTFTTSQGGSLSVSVQAVNGVFAQLEIEDNLSREIFETEPNDGINTGVATLEAGRTYFVRLRAPRNDAAEYRVDLVLGGSTGGGGGGGGGGGTGALPSALTETEPNDRQASADAFAFSDTGLAQLVGTSTSDDDKDFFVFTPLTSGRVAVSVSGGAKLQVETGGLSVFETEPNNGVNSGSFDVTAGQTYFVRLRAPGDAAVSYQVDLSLT